MNIWFSADTHFGHKNIIGATGRPFKNIDEMDATLIANHNALVKPDDEWYFLGDFALCPAQRAVEILEQLNGIKYCVQGNHHTVMHNKKVASYFEWIRDYHTLKVKDIDAPFGRQLIVLCHFPILVWNEMHLGSWMLHGHCHHTLNFDLYNTQPILDVGVDGYNYKPICYEQVKAIMSTYTLKSIDHHKKPNC